MKLTKVIVKKWDACAEGYKYFLENFPQGGDYAAVQSKLHADKKFEWASWLTNAAWKAAFETPAEMYALTKSEVDQTIADAKDSPQSATGYGSTAASSGDGSKAASSGNYSKAASSGYGSTAASSGDGSTAASSGNYSKAASSGNYSKAASSGNYSKAASSGDGSTAASSGYGSTAASSGYGSKAASSGDGSTAASSGYGTVAFVAGIDGSAKAGDNGCIALCYYDGKRNRVLVGYVGEDGIEADTFYVARGGKLVKQV